MKKKALQFILVFLSFAIYAQGKTEPVRKSNKIRTYLPAKRIVWISDSTNQQIINSRNLLIPGNGQADLSNNNLCEFINSNNQQASVILDFGKEIQGGLEIVTGNLANKPKVKVRLRFGESVAETFSEVSNDGTATNDHAMRDFEVELPWLGKIEVGNTGFRFVRIDLLGENSKMLLKEVNAISIYRDIPYLGSFNSSDTLLNKIWETGAYTVHLNMQDYLWDGIKRDRLVWVGDLHPEVMTVNSVFGYNEVVPKSLDLIRDITPANEWMNGISSYSMWWIIIHKEWFYQNGNLEYLKQQKQYLTELLNKFCSLVDANGQEHLDGSRFLDWPSSPDPLAVNAGYHALLKMTLEAGAELCTVLNDNETAELCNSKSKLMAKLSPDPSNSKQAAALLTLSNSISPEKGNAIITDEGAKRFSTFYGYYMLLAMAKAENYSEAMDIIKEYWGGMIELGATTFWEDFDVEWVKNANRIDQLPSLGKIDVHSTYGDYCYKGLRHSFCHGWASGPTSWLSENVLGIKILEPGCKKIAVEPHLGNLDWVEGTYPTPLGVISVRHEMQQNGKIKSSISVPKGIKVIKK